MRKVWYYVHGEVRCCWSFPSVILGSHFAAGDAGDATVSITNWMTYLDHDYATLDNAIPNDYSQVTCQSGAILLPSGWELAPVGANTTAALLGSGTKFGACLGVTVWWRRFPRLPTADSHLPTATTCLVLADGSSVFANDPLTPCLSGQLQSVGQYYGVLFCDQRIAIRRPRQGAPSSWGSVAALDAELASSVFGQLFLTLDGTVGSVESAGCQEAPLQLPSGWAIAPWTMRATQEAVRRQRFGTVCLVTADGGSYFAISGAACGTSQLLSFNGLLTVKECFRRVLVWRPGTNVGYCQSWGAFEGQVLVGESP